MSREELNMEDLGNVTGGSFSFNRNNGKCAIGDMNSSSLWQITADYSMVGNALDAIMNGSGSDAEKNAKMINLIVSNGWGTRLL